MLARRRRSRRLPGGRGDRGPIVLGLAIAAGVARCGLVRGAMPASARRRSSPSRSDLAALFASIPFIAAGDVGILGVGLVNDDMASHLLIADYVADRYRSRPSFVEGGTRSGRTRSPPPSPR